MPKKRKSDPIDGAVEPNGDPGSSKRARHDTDLDATMDASSAGVAAPITAYDGLRDIILEGEHDGTLRVYDDCDDVRRKIRLLCATPRFERDAWLNELNDVDDDDLKAFMEAKGPQVGADNPTYRSAYVYFEKVRIRDNRPKTKKRMEAETNSTV
ncbi:hypothetical protein EXIGLDRAFT_769001 [Exidia glandulosa HHB12029]|uniref:DUF7726 domain-containing protein n=1 Tax=Exidia glandulosa HHB12029 TaxID=1314781 RepID=A0A165HTV1_EXIGL|nr:hypothetical protein EXIGLDRAFT_769001 [Exidia glandulosa HHB12029]